MPTFTTRLGLIKPGYADDVDVADLNANADDIDAVIGAPVVTSTTRPGSPFTGQLIYESDTSNTLVWDGTAWQTVSSSSLLAETTEKTADYTLVLGDAGKVVQMNKTTAGIVTIPLNSSVAYPAGTVVGIYNKSAASVSIVGASGVTIRNNDTAIGQYGEVSLRYRGSNEWVVAGPQYEDNPGNNLLYNGAMQVHQRGTAATGITSFGYRTADRWLFTGNFAGTWTQTIENDAPTGSGFRKSLKTLVTTADAAPAAGTYMAIQQALEGQDCQIICKGTSSAKSLTLSFWVKSNVTGTYIAEVVDRDNNRSVSIPYNIGVSNTWEKKILAVPADTSGVLDNDTAVSFDVGFALVAGSNFTSGTLQTTWGSLTNANRAVGQTNLAAATNNYWQVTGVQLEVGPVATPFEFKSYGTELAECQRYYHRISPAADVRMGTGYNTATTTGIWHIPLPVEMRIAPTALEQSGTAADYAVQHGNFTLTNFSAVPVFSGGTRTSVYVVGTVASGLTAGQGSMLYARNTSAYLGWSAEL